MQEEGRLMTMRKKNIGLCRPCMEKVKDLYILRPSLTGVNMKVSCDLCGKRRYGAVYEKGEKKS